jgi:hypothetical protein
VAGVTDLISVEPVTELGAIFGGGKECVGQISLLQFGLATGQDRHR